MYIEEWGKILSRIRAKYQKQCFLQNTVVGFIWWRSGKRFIIDHKQLQFDKTYGWTLIGIPEKEDGSLSDHEYFFIHDDLFDIIQSTHQDQKQYGGFHLMN